VVRVSYDDPVGLDAVFRGASVIVHLVGILVEPLGSTYQQANIAPARSFVEAAKRTAAVEVRFGHCHGG
jgi:hypothetical protein